MSRWCNGSHAAFRTQWSKDREGSTPSLGTKEKMMAGPPPWKGVLVGFALGAFLGAVTVAALWSHYG